MYLVKTVMHLDKGCIKINIFNSLNIFLDFIGMFVYIINLENF